MAERGNLRKTAVGSSQIHSPGLSLPTGLAILKGLVAIAATKFIDEDGVDLGSAPRAHTTSRHSTTF